MAKRLLTAALSLFLSLALFGCAGFIHQNINELLRAPALGGGLDEIQNALTDYLDGAEPQYKYPKEGDWRSPLMQADFNGDGKEEAVLLYSRPDAASLFVNVALLEQVAGEWQVVQNLEGKYSEVASLELADLLGDGTRQLIVGYGSTANKSFVLYTYGDGALQAAFQREYSRYEIGDFTGRGGNELVVVSGDAGSITLEYITAENGEFVTDAQPVALNSNFKSCDNIVPSLGPDGTRLLVVDGPMDSDMLFSQMVYYSGEHFYTVDDSGALRAASARRNTLLLSRDIDGDGTVEIPVLQSEAQTPNADKRLEFIEWMDFITVPEGKARQFGLMDSDRGVYVRLPDEWRGSLSLTDGDNPGEWRLQNERTRQALLSVQIVESGESLPLNSRRVEGSVNSYLVFGSGLSEQEREIISMTLIS